MMTVDELGNFLTGDEVLLDQEIMIEYESHVPHDFKTGLSVNSVESIRVEDGKVIIKAKAE